MGLSLRPRIFSGLQAQFRGVKSMHFTVFRNPWGPPTHPGRGRPHYLNVRVILIEDNGYSIFRSYSYFQVLQLLQQL